MSNIEKDIAELTEKAIAQRVFPGCVVGYVTRDGARKVFPFGNFTYEEGSEIVRADSIYDVASVTKSLATGALAIMLIDQGKLRLSDKLVEYLPEFRNSDRDNVLIKHLLTYTIEGYGLASLPLKTSIDLFDTLMTRDFAKKPGTTFAYTNIPAALTGLVIERITRETIDALADRYFYEPLHMTRTTFFPERFPLEEIAPTEIDDWRGLVRGVVHDESAYICKQEGKIVGHAGLFSTAPNILNFLEMLLNDGISHGKAYFSPKIIMQMETNQIPELHEYTGLGWELYQPRYMGKYATEHTFGKTGFTGTLAVCDREKGVAYTILSNRTFPKRPLDSTAIHRFRKTVGEVILGHFASDLSTKL